MSGADDVAPLGPTIAEFQAAGDLPVFPQMARSGDLAVSEGGMTLRDYFAAKAMQAMITKSHGQDKTGGAGGVPLIAEYAYEFADAMLAARGVA